MSPSSSLLTLGSGPGCVHEARRWVALRCEDLGRSELSECAEAGVSELVTNALLHAQAPIQVRVTGTSDRPRIEVHDASTEAPELPDPEQVEAHENDDLPLLTFGRGLCIVARSSHAWGADIDLSGKVVWFEPAPTWTEDRLPQGQITGLGSTSAGTAVPEVEVEGTLTLRAVPVGLLADSMSYHRELSREARLLAMARDSSGSLTTDLSETFAALDHVLREAKVLARPDRTLTSSAEADRVIDIRVRLTDDLLPALGRLSALLERADALSREGGLLTVARSSEQRAFQTWFLLDLVAQGDGAEPVSWSAHLASRPGP